jgi:hypothetical protein
MISHQTSSTGTDRGDVCARIGSLCDAADILETTVTTIAGPVRRKIGFSVDHALLLASMGDSIALFVSSRKDLATIAR